MDIAFEELKEACKRVSQCQPINEHSITQDLVMILEAIQERQHKDLPMLAAKTILEFRQFSINSKLANDILMGLCSVALETRQWDVLRFVLDPEKQFFRFHDQVQIDDTRLSTGECDWEFSESLKEDQVIDALKEDDKFGVIVWSKGRVYKLNEKFVWVRWLGDSDSKRKIQRYSADIAPEGTKCKDFEWRHSLEPGDLIDCLDNKVWQVSTILSKVVEDNCTEYNIGFRFYDPTGPQTDYSTDRAVKTFYGWSQQYDERLKADNPRIQKVNTFSKAFCRHASLGHAEETILDCNDYLYGPYAVPRFNTKSFRKSQIIIDLLNQFGQQGGFKVILESVPTAPIDLLHTFMIILGNNHEMLSRSLVLEIVPNLWQSLKNNILNTTDGNLRNFSTQKVNDILIAAGALLKRVYSLKEKTEMIEKVDLDIAFKCFSSEFLERKIQGLKAIQELIKKTKDSNNEISDMKYLTIQLMVDWLNEKKIFETLYVNQNNTHLVQRSAEFFKFMLDEKLVTNEHIANMWHGANKSETEHKLAIYKLLKDVSSNLDKEQLDQLTNKVCQKEASSISKEDIELLSDLTKYNYRFKEEYCQRFASFYLQSLLSGRLSSQMSEHFMQCYIEQVTSFEMRPHKSSQINNLGSAIVGSKQVSTILRLLVKFIDKLEIQPSSWDQYTRNVALTELEQKHHIVQAIVTSLSEIKQLPNYIDEVKTRMHFIQFFYQNISTLELRLTFSVISELWEQLVCNSTSQQERDLVYKWFSALSTQQADGQSQLSSMVPVEDLKNFFTHKMTSEQQILNLTEEGFACFKTVLQAINRYEQQFGLEVLWSVILKTQSLKVCQLAIELYHSYSQDLGFVFQELAKNNHLYRCLLVLEDIIDQSEVMGVGDLRSLNALSKGEEITVSVINEHSSMPFVPKKMQIRIADNESIIQLRLAISKLIKASWDSIGLTATKGEIKATENGKMIKDLRLKKGETLLCFKKNTKDPPEVALLDENNNLTQSAQRVFLEIFNEYSHDGKMNKEDCTRFVTGCTGNPCTVEDSNISRTFEQFDRDKDGFLLPDDFLDFYTESTRTKRATVWLNLQTLHYRSDLIRGDRVLLPEISAEHLPRGVISRNQEWIDTLFGLLENPDRNVSEQAWYLLRRLPPSQSFLNKMLTFEGITSEQDWDGLLVDSDFRLLYSLYVIEYLMSGERGEWMSRFLQLGGFDRLLEYFKQYQCKSVGQLSITEKEILSFLLRTFQQYLLAACSCAKQQWHVLAIIGGQEHPTAEFIELVSKMNETGLGESLLIKFELPKLLRVLIGLLDELVTLELESEEKSILEYSLVTVILILSHEQNLLEISLRDAKFLSLLFRGLYSSMYELFTKAILVLCHENPLPNQVILRELIADPKHNAQYYDLLSRLLDAQKDHPDLDMKSLTDSIVKALLNHKSTENRSKNTPVDKVLVGILSLLDKLTDWIEELDVFHLCLFSDSYEEILCKSNESRQAAFKLLLKIQSDDLVESLQKLSTIIPVINKWNYIPALDMRSHTGYAGLKNLRYICYMNAMLQQFYMTPPFRYGILKAQDHLEPDLQELRGEVYDDNVLHQLQYMFASLELTDRVDFTPQEFCMAFKDYSGEPVNINIQQDAQEFLNMILDKLEQQLKPTAFRYLLDGVYGGKTCTQIVCSECKFSKNKIEQFYNLSLPIKNIKTLHECFEKYIQGETISDFRCDNCEKKVDVQKRQLLSELPNCLILHLQRIVFNLDTFMNDKINSRVEFPMALDLKEYTIDLKEGACTQYKLVGVVVHLGTADVGHYFSYIDTDRHGNGQGEQWLEFNDSKIKEFKLKNLEAECFGGQSNLDYSETDMWGSRENSQSAYMLVYEKIVKDPLLLVFQSEEELLEAQLNYKDSVRDGLTLKINYHDIGAQVPEHYQELVNADNQEFLLERNLFSADLMKFISEVCEQQKGDRRLIEVLFRFNYDLLARAYDNSIMETFSEKLNNLIETYPDNSYLDMVFKQNKSVDLLLVCPETRTRKYYAKLLSILFNQYIAINNVEDIYEHDAWFLNYLDNIFNLIQNEVPKNWARFDQYFQFWLDFLNGGQAQAKYLLQKQMVAYMLDFILDKHSPIQLYEKKHSVGNSYYQVNYQIQLQIVIQLLKYGQLTITDKILLYSYRLYDKLFKVNKLDDLIPLVLQFSKNNQYYSEIISGCLIRGLTSPDVDDLKVNIAILKQFILIDDNYKRYRIEWLLGIPTAKQTAVAIKQKELTSYGCYGQQSLEDDHWSFTSPLGWQSTLFEYFTMNKTHKNFDTQCLAILKCILQLAIEDKDCFDYIKSLPTTNYLYKYQEDVFKAFLDTYIIDSKRYFHSYPRKQESDEVKILLDRYFEMVTPYRNEFFHHDYIVGKSIEVSSAKRMVYLINRDTKEQVIHLDSSEEYEQLKEQIEDGTYYKLFILEEKIINTYICDNIPTGQTNEGLSAQYVKGAQFYNYQIDQNSKAALFIQSKGWNNYEVSSMIFTKLDLDQEQDVKNIRQVDSVKTISLMNNHFKKSMHVILKIDGDDSAHFIPKSPIQSSMSPKSTAIMFTTIKNNSEQAFPELNLTLTYYKQDKKAADSHIYLSTPEQQNLQNL